MAKIENGEWGVKSIIWGLRSAGSERRVGDSD